MIAVIVIFVYLAVIAFIGSIAYKRGQDNTEDFFLASRSIGSMVFFLSLFATNMTAFAILGSSGQAYRRGIGIYGMMASSSCLVIPLTIFFIGTRLWALGKKFGHQTQVSFFRDRWECNHIGTAIFALSAAMLIPYMIISIMGGGTVLEGISLNTETHHSLISYPFGCATVAVVVTANVFFGGMRGTVWVNIFQTILFLCFGLVAVAVISHALPLGFGDYIGKLAGDEKSRFLVTREKMPPQVFWSYTLIPLSSIMFPHMAMMCFSARRVTAFKRTVIAYPIAIMVIWLPCIFLGVIGFAALGKIPNPDEVLLRLLHDYSPAWLAGILGAGIISAVMGSDAHQVLAMSTMFTKDVFDHYGGGRKGVGSRWFQTALDFLAATATLGALIWTHIWAAATIVWWPRLGPIPLLTIILFFLIACRFLNIGRKKFGEYHSVHFARGFIVLVTVIAYLVALQLKEKQGIFEIAVRYAFSGFAAMSPVMIAALFWKRSTKWGALASTLYVAAFLVWNAFMQSTHKAGDILWQIGEGKDAIKVFFLTPAGDVAFCNGYMTVVPMVLGSILCVILFSLATRPPSQATINKYFDTTAFPSAA